ncbi:MAG: AAA family ATPase [Candidatus Marithrix sp.]|nr:AAA family ATPase [Candidatus Marithrix sp.]
MAINNPEPVENITEDKLDFNEDFKNAYNLMEENSKCIFITGKAGTGKSTLLNYFKTKTKKKIVVLAPTGIAALNVGGATLHSFFRLPPRPLNPDEIKPLSNSKLYKSVDTIIIDEVSMVRADMLDVIDRFMRLNGKDRFKPFGGVQMVFIGDLFQLPPVVSNDEEAKLFTNNYTSPFFLSAKVFTELKIKLVELTKVYRHKDQEFINLLNAIRSNQACASEIQRINQRYQPKFDTGVEDYFITLTTTNKIAAQINVVQLEKLTTTLHNFIGEIKGKFDQPVLPTDQELSLKVNAQIMFVKNDSEGRWVNGTLGRIKKIQKTQIKVVTQDNKTHNVKPVKWEILTYNFDKKTQVVTTEVLGSFTQYPLKLAWAITIHKSQGKQFDKVIIDLGWGAFAHGQLYVALSRCRTLEGLILKTKVRPKDVIVDKRVQELFSSYTGHKN